MDISATDCVARHMAEKARQGCALHRAVHQMISSPGAAGYHCVACESVFDSRHAAFVHIEQANDAGHNAYKLARQAAERPAVDGAGPPLVRAGMGEAAVAVASAAASADPAAADRALAEEEVQRRREAAASASLYAAAKMGHTDAVIDHLRRGADVNALHDDGFTPLMTSAEAGHADVVHALANHPACDPLVRNVYGQTALHFAAQNGRVAAVYALLDAPQSAPVLGPILDAKAGGCTAAEKARRAGHASLASTLANRAEEHQLALLLHELTEPAIGLQWVLGAVPRGATPNNELDGVTHSSLSNALAAGQLTFTHSELDAHRVDRLALRASHFLRRAGTTECWMPVAGGASASGPFDSMHARLAALCKAVDVPLPKLRDPTDAAFGLPSSLYDDDDECMQIDDGLPQCCVCLDQHVDTALMPCFHASFCKACAGSLLERGARCPIARCTVMGMQRIFL